MASARGVLYPLRSGNGERISVQLNARDRNKNLFLCLIVLFAIPLLKHVTCLLTTPRAFSTSLRTLFNTVDVVVSFLDEKKPSSKSHPMLDLFPNQAKKRKPSVREVKHDI